MKVKNLGENSPKILGRYAFRQKDKIIIHGREIE
jgi:hypothetical protein